MGDLLVPITEAKARLSEIVRESQDRNVLLMKHGRPGAVVISASRYDDLMERIEDMSDRLSVYEREGVTIGLDKLKAELGLTVGA
ncbi:MAG: type II toxin-antitoxin system prevent-host-death family antitoxin [Sporichthyaceae bacterium]